MFLSKLVRQMIVKRCLINLKEGLNWLQQNPLLAIKQIFMNALLKY